MQIKKFLIVLILMSAVAYIVYAAAPNPGHKASEVGGDQMADRTFMDEEYSFPDKLAVGKGSTVYAVLDVEGPDNAIRGTATTEGIGVVGKGGGLGAGVYGSSDTTMGVLGYGATSGVVGQSDICDFRTAGSAKYCFGGGSYLTVGSSCSAGEIQIGSNGHEVLCFGYASPS